VPAFAYSGAIRAGSGGAIEEPRKSMSRWTTQLSFRLAITHKLAIVSRDSLIKRSNAHLLNRD